MKIDLNVASKDLKEGKWVTYYEDISFKIRHLSDKKVGKIQTRHTKSKFRAGQYIPVTDNDGASDEMFDFALEDWNFTDAESKPYECDKKNKELFRNNYYSQVPPGADEKLLQSYGNFITGYSRDLNNYLDVKKEEAEQKNS